MSAIKIESYRGWDILFDTNKETFYTLTSNIYEDSVTKKSYSAIKKFIDDFIKENNTFVPFKVHSKFNPDDVRTIIGIRKDGDFVYQDEQGKQIKFGVYEEDNYILFEPENVSVYDEIKTIDTQIDDLRNEKEALRTDLKITTVSNIKHLYKI